MIKQFKENDTAFQNDLSKKSEEKTETTNEDKFLKELWLKFRNP